MADRASHTANANTGNANKILALDNHNLFIAGLHSKTAINLMLEIRDYTKSARRRLEQKLKHFSFPKEFGEILQKAVKSGRSHWNHLKPIPGKSRVC
jgi:hypothetical protein